MLVLSPTRELALQIEAEVKKFHYRGIKRLADSFPILKFQEIKYFSLGMLNLATFTPSAVLRRLVKYYNLVLSSELMMQFRVSKSF